MKFLMRARLLIRGVTGPGGVAVNCRLLDIVSADHGSGIGYPVCFGAGLQ